MSQMQEDLKNPSHDNSSVGFPGTNQVQQPQSSKNWKWLLVLILFLVVIGGVTFFVFKSSRSATSLEESPTPDTSLTNFATPDPTPSPSSTPAADKSTIKIEVLNGTGIAGEAGLLSDALKDLGYTSVTTGNASNQNATETVVMFSPTIDQAVITEITGKLKELYTTVTTDNTKPADSDIEITTGLRKGQSSATASPAASTSPSSTPTPSPAN